MSEPRIKN